MKKRIHYWNYRVNLFRNHTEVAIPFLVSTRNYGILWDKYSVSWVGGVRAFQPLFYLKLFAKYGQQEWINASYWNDKNNPSQVTFERSELEINYEFLSDSNQPCSVHSYYSVAYNQHRNDCNILDSIGAVYAVSECR